MKFIVKNNGGNLHISKEYYWSKDDGIPDEETILQDMEQECNIYHSESQGFYDFSLEFNEGEVVDVLLGDGLRRGG